MSDVMVDEQVPESWGEARRVWGERRSIRWGNRWWFGVLDFSGLLSRREFFAFSILWGSVLTGFGVLVYGANVVPWLRLGTAFPFLVSGEWKEVPGLSLYAAATGGILLSAVARRMRDAGWSWWACLLGLLFWAVDFSGTVFMTLWLSVWPPAGWFGRWAAMEEIVIARKQREVEARMAAAQPNYGMTLSANPDGPNAEVQSEVVEAPVLESDEDLLDWFREDRE